MRKRLKKKLVKKARYAHWGKPISFPLYYPATLLESTPKQRSWGVDKQYRPEISMDLFMGLCRMGREK